jgi:hypothetical protein
VIEYLQCLRSLRQAASVFKNSKKCSPAEERELKMIQSMTYKGYTIQPAPRQLVDTGQWELNVFISWATEDEEDSRHFVKTGRYATEDEATAQCIIHGQQIVDGQVPGLSVG